jgi:hypothetical protein
VPDAELTTEDLRTFQKAAARWVFVAWLAGESALIAALALSGSAQRFAPPGTRPQIAVPVMIGRVVLFPGIQVTSYVASRLRVGGARPPSSGKSMPLVGIALIAIDLAVVAVVWGWLLPWLITAMRVYLWPRRAFLKGGA